MKYIKAIAMVLVTFLIVLITFKETLVYAILAGSFEWSYILLYIIFTFIDFICIDIDLFVIMYLYREARGD